ncbi:hypothetical protein RAA17_12435 [Komagataeibacter rhaeticus]|nr:hypothetical protein [Komagataeibacter rhaeticus]
MNPATGRTGKYMMQHLSRFAFACASIMLMLLALALLIFGMIDLVAALGRSWHAGATPSCRP